jgi:two-component system, LytTR family, response regulator
MNPQPVLPGLMRSPIQLSDVVWLEGDSNYTRFHFVKGPTLIVSKSLYLYELSMADDPRFVRTHKTAIVNRTFINSVVKIGKRLFALRLYNGETIRIARSKRQLIKELTM